MAKLKTIKETNGTVGKSRTGIPSSEMMEDILSVLESAVQLAEYVEVTGDATGRRMAIRMQEILAKVSRKHRLKISS